MGLLRQYLVENFGLIAARAVLTQFGFAHGWRMEAMQKEFNWATSKRTRQDDKQKQLIRNAGCSKRVLLSRAF